MLPPIWNIADQYPVNLRSERFIQGIMACSRQIAILLPFYACRPFA